jgi:3-oxoacyl-[acyl-carrier protein] reductase
MQYDLQNKVALVTGGSRGLGASIATALALRGAKVALNYFSRTKDAEEVRSAIVTVGGVAEIFQGDVTDEDQVIDICRSVKQTLGPIDILVPNATLVHVHKKIEALSWRDMLDHLDYFVKSPLLLAQQVVPLMKERRFGRIINIGSEVFEIGMPGFSSYVAAKGAQLGLTRSWQMNSAHIRLR